MLHVRRSEHESRIEIMPLIDVIFLLLTFFIYALVLMVRADLVPMKLQSFESGEAARPAPAVTVSIDRDGALYVDRDPVALDEVVGRLRAATERDPDTVVFVASEAEGDVDRLPVFLALYDRLAFAGLDIRLVGAEDDEDAGGSPEQ